MIVATIAGLALSQAVPVPTSAIAEYFPSAVGTKWTYSYVAGTLKTEYVDEIFPSIEIGGKPTVPIGTKGERGEFMGNYYRVDGDTVVIVATDPKKPYPVPFPVFKLDTKKTEWKFSGVTSFFGDQVPVNLTGVSAPKGKKNLFGIDRDCVEVTLNAEILIAQGSTMKAKQVFTYAKGLGLIELESQETLGRETKKSTVKLIRFEAPK